VVFGKNWFLVKIGFWSKLVFGQNRFLVKAGFWSKQAGQFYLDCDQNMHTLANGMYPSSAEWGEALA
jgi:hypothetical protein